MAKNDLILLDGILEDYISKQLPSKDPGEVFEYFSIEQILKDFAFNQKQLLSGSVDGRNDGGIDQFFIMVNGHLAEEIPDGFWPKTNAELEVYIVTCKHDDSFKQAPITTMIPSLMQLLDFGVDSNDLKDSYNEKIIKKRNLLISTYKRLASALVKFDIHIVYACRGDEVIESNIQAKADQAREICQDSFSECSATFEFWGNKKLLEKYRIRAKKAIDLNYEQCINQNGQYVLLTKLSDYYNFITDETGKLNKKLFDANVRDYLGLNPVNLDILTSLSNVDGPNFWWLNNGITIIGSKAVIVGNSITVEDVKIVNGLQTSESIYNYFSEPRDDVDARSLLVKIIITNDVDTCKSIIYATNNQTNVNVTALRATDEIQCDIEDILRANGIYYERRTNYYQNLGIDETDIITPLSLAAGYMCLIYKNPNDASSLKQKFMRNNEKYERIFSSDVNLNLWVTIAKLIKLNDKYLNELKPYVGKNTVKFLKTYRHIVLFLTVSRILKSFSFQEKAIISFDIDLYSKAEVQITINDLLEVDGECFDKIQKLSSAFYLRCYTHIAQKYSIKDIKAIAAIKNKMWPQATNLKSNKLSEEVLNSVFEKLPAQPWPPKIHSKIATELNIKEITVSNAIAYLIYTGKLNYQVYGFVFDAEENIVAEGEHFGRGEDEARQKMKQQQRAFAEKFQF